MAISSIGVGSGLPLDQLLSDLRKAESQPLQLIKQRKDLTEARISSYGVIKNSLANLQKAAQALGDTDKFGALKGKTSNEDVLGVKATNSAIAGSYNVTVNSMATHQSLVAAEGQASRIEKIGEETGGTLTIKLANNKSASIDLGDDTSLEGIMKSINANPDLGVQATMVNDGSDTPYRLMITAKDTGTEASVVSIEVTGNTGVNDALRYDAQNKTDNYSTDPSNQATNASISVNGINIISQSNEIEDVIEGVTIDLKNMPANGESVRIDVARDDSVTTDAVKAYVKEYNALLDTIKKQTSYDVENETSSVLTGDSMLRRIENQLRGAMNGADRAGEINTLADLGVKTDYKTGRLEIEEDKLKKAIEDNLNDVTAFFVGENGISKRVDNTTNEFVRSGGLISSTTDNMSRTVRMMEDQYNRASDRIDVKMENYKKQFTQLDMMVNQMNGTSQYLAQQLDMLANMNKPKK